MGRQASGAVTVTDGETVSFNCDILIHRNSICWWRCLYLMWKSVRNVLEVQPAVKLSWNSVVLCKVEVTQTYKWYHFNHRSWTHICKRTETVGKKKFQSSDLGMEECMKLSNEQHGLPDSVQSWTLLLEAQTRVHGQLAIQNHFLLLSSTWTTLHTNILVKSSWVVGAFDKGKTDEGLLCYFCSTINSSNFYFLCAGIFYLFCR